MPRGDKPAPLVEDRARLRQPNSMSIVPLAVNSSSPLATRLAAGLRLMAGGLQGRGSRSGRAVPAGRTAGKKSPNERPGPPSTFRSSPRAVTSPACAAATPADPLLRQVLPLEDELADAPGFTADPVGDRAARRRPGLLHKYRSRVLMVTTGACAVHCRYCFRRHFPYSEGPPASRLAAGPRLSRRRPLDSRGHSQRRRPADACRRSAGRARRPLGRNPARAAPADPHAAADRDPRAGHRRARDAAARHAA